MNKYFTTYFIMAFMFFFVESNMAQSSVLSWDFESNTIGDTFNHIGWYATDIQSVVADDPVASGNNVLKNTVHNYNAAPVLMFVLPSGKTLADYDSLTFKGYFEKGDVGYKDIIVEAYQAMPSAQFGNNDAAKVGSWTRSKGASTDWENIAVDITNSTSLSDTVYLAFGISCAGDANGDTTTWYADDVELVAKSGDSTPSTILSWNFDSNTLGDTIDHIGWYSTDIQSIVADDPVTLGNNVLKNTVHNYNAAPVLMFVLPSGKTLADYDSLTFKGYFEKGDVGYKDIIVEAYQTMPSAQFGNNDTAKVGSWTRSKGASTDWENIAVDITNSTSLSDTVYLAFGISCAGDANGDTTTWYADDVNLIAKVNSPKSDTGNVVTNGGFEDSNTGIVDTTGVKGWIIQVASTVNPPSVFEIVSDTVEDGNRALKVTVNGLGTNQWDTQIVADSLHIKPQVTYDYSVWAKADKPGAQVNFTVGGYTTGEYAAIRPANLTTSWKKYTLSFIVTSSDTVIRGPIHFNYAGNVDNAIYIDNLRIAEHIVVIDSSLVWKGPALATGSPKFLGSAGDYPDNHFIDYWTQITPENAGKWGSVARSQDTTQWDWSGLDRVYDYAETNNLIFKDHTLIWGAQQPSWISSLDSAQQALYIETWIRQVGQRYPNTVMIDVVNECLNGHNPPDGLNGRANYKKALGGNGTTGWDWVIKSFELARKYLPNAKLLINDYGILNSNEATTSYLYVINLLKDRGLIDGIGCQGHGFENTSAATIKSNLDRLAATGLPIYITEFDLSIQNDAQQKTKYQELFPVMWQHPAVKGVTLWGYIQGRTWVPYSYLINSDGTARPALWWLAQYIKDFPVGVKETTSTLPTDYELEQNYPNPFNPTTKIRYSISNTTKVTLKVYDILGRELQTLVNNIQAPGKYTVTFNGQNLASGVYFYRIIAGDFVSTKKLMLLK